MSFKNGDKVVDVTQFIENTSDLKTYKVIECVMHLDRNTVLEGMKHEFIKINGVLYLTPQRQLLELFIQNKFPGLFEMKFMEKPKHVSLRDIHNNNK